MAQKMHLHEPRNFIRDISYVFVQELLRSFLNSNDFQPIARLIAKEKVTSD